MSQRCHTRTSHDSFDHLVDGREKPGEKTYAEPSFPEVGLVWT